MNLPRARSIIWLTLLILSCLLAVLFYYQSGSSQTAPNEGPNQPASGNHNALSPEQEEAIHQNAFRSKERTPQTTEAEVPLRELKKQVENFFQEQEALRCRTLAEYEHEGVTNYVIAVDPPDPATIKSARETIASLSRSCAAQDAQAFDHHVQELISNYDPFGTMGKKAFYIRLPKQGDEIQGMSGFVFTVDTFDGLAESLDPKSGQKVTLKQTKGYMRSGPGILDRFQAVFR